MFGQCPLQEREGERMVPAAFKFLPYRRMVAKIVFLLR
jgi:hypothetical protein